MSRSRHTDPRMIRARRRIAAPRASRGANDPRLRRRIGRMLKEAGIYYESCNKGARSLKAGPRIAVRRPGPGFFHPLAAKDIERILAFIGPQACYGLRRVELARTETVYAQRSRVPLLGRLIVPGRIILYEQAVPPWRIAGIIAARDAQKLRLAGAGLEIHTDTAVTVVNWPDEALRSFMLFDVFLHELGHHILQHHAGKRTRRIARTRDHEAFAERFAEQYRSAWLAKQESRS